MEYMKVGQLAKKVGTTVRTLQYYDKQGLLSPSGASEGGFRLYTHKDMVKYLQIYTLKQLGLTLSQIKEALPALDTPQDMVALLTQQATDIQAQIEKLSQSLADIQQFQAEVTYMNTIDFKKYAAILTSLQMKQDSYWAVKFFDDNMLDHLDQRFADNHDLAESIGTRMDQFNRQARTYAADGLSPHSPEAHQFAKIYWEAIMDFTDGGSTIFLTTHNMEEATLLCDRVVMLHQGRIIEEGPPKDICNRHQATKTMLDLESVFVKLTGGQLS